MIRHQFETDIGVVEIRSTDRDSGSFALSEPQPDLDARRRVVCESADRRWVALRQVHGADVIRPDRGAAGLEPVEADGAATTAPGVALSVLTADCAPVVLVGTTGVAAVHAGWRGAAAGVIDNAAAELIAAGSRPVATVLGPCIQPAAYEFGEADLEPIVEAFGPEVRGRTANGAPALDLTRVVQLSCERAGWPVPDRPDCTSAPRFFSHRTRTDVGRQATVAWIEPAPFDPEQGEAR